MKYGVGIDISKGKSTIAIVDENFRLVERIMEESAYKYCKSLPIPAEANVGKYWIH